MHAYSYSDPWYPDCGLDIYPDGSGGASIDPDVLYPGGQGHTSPDAFDIITGGGTPATGDSAGIDIPGVLVG